MFGTRSRNPFDDDEETGGFGSSLDSSKPNTQISGLGSISSRTYTVQTEILDSQSRTKASQQRALASIHDSERIGVNAAQELIEQGEKLNRAEEKLDEISELQKDSQKKINTLSSVFGGFKNIFRRHSQPTQPAQSVVEKSPDRSRDEFKQSLQYSNSWGNAYVDELKNNSTETMVDKKSSDVEFERNLSLMSDGISRLKGLAQGMNEEIRTQNTQLDRMAPRLDRITDTLNSQNKQMNKLLGIKPK